MENIRIAVAQFQPRDGDKSYNLSVIEMLTKEAKSKGADVISFHELSITAYTFLKNLTKDQVFYLSEEIPGGLSCHRLMQISEKHQIAILAGLVEKEGDKIFNSYICVNRGELLAKFRKLHPFISPYLSPGNEYVTFGLLGWKCGILICYDKVFPALRDITANHFLHLPASVHLQSPCSLQTKPGDFVIFSLSIIIYWISTLKTGTLP